MFTRLQFVPLSSIAEIHLPLRPRRRSVAFGQTVLVVASALSSGAGGGAMSESSSAVGACFSSTPPVMCTSSSLVSATLASNALNICSREYPRSAANAASSASAA